MTVVYFLIILYVRIIDVMNARVFFLFNEFDDTRLLLAAGMTEDPIFHALSC